MIADLIKIYREARERSEAKIPNAEAHDQAIEMALMKIGRIATGKLKDDNYDDLIGYTTLAKEVSLCN